MSLLYMSFVFIYVCFGSSGTNERGCQRSQSYCVSKVFPKCSQSYCVPLVFPRCSQS